MTSVLFVLCVLVVVVAYFLYVQVQKSKELRREVLTLNNWITVLATPVPFGLRALESVGHALGGLTEKIISTAYVVAVACSRPNTVAADVATAKESEARAISQTRNDIADLQNQVAFAQDALLGYIERDNTLTQIGALLPAPTK